MLGFSDWGSRSLLPISGITNIPRACQAGNIPIDSGAIIHTLDFRVFLNGGRINSNACAFCHVAHTISCINPSVSESIIPAQFSSRERTGRGLYLYK